jgi:hypothetical protein
MYLAVAADVTMRWTGKEFVDTDNTYE